jgi:hypothetical protein
MLTGTGSSTNRIATAVINRVRRITGVWCLGAILIGAAPNVGSRPNQNTGALNIYAVGAGEHIARGEFAPANLEATPTYQQGGAALPPPVMAPTRSSFLAVWDSVSGATRYRLDVSTTSSFRTYVRGYQDSDMGNVTNHIVSRLSPGTTYYYRVRAYNALGTRINSNVMTATTATTSGLVINPTFDSSITSDPNSAAIQSMISQAIATYQSLFSDSITISILFRYSTTAPNGNPISSGTLARSNYVIYTVSWNTYITALTADGKTGNDTLANASLPASPLSTNIVPSSANGRAVGLNTPPAMFGNGSVGSGGPYDGIVTLNSANSFQFTRPTSGSNYDALRSTEHEMDEVLGLGSHLNSGSNDLRPQDLFSWAAPAIRNTTSAASRYFSINSGITDIVDFNQVASADFGDWLSAFCPQTNPYVQNALGCPGQSSDVTATSPEGINLDVIGYDLSSIVMPQVSAVNFSSTTGFTLTWTTKAGSTYQIQRSTDPSFTTYTIIASGIPAVGPTTSFTDASPEAKTATRMFYRVGLLP